MLQVEGNIVDIENRKIGFGVVSVQDDKISGIEIRGDEKMGPLIFCLVSLTAMCM